MSHVDGSSDLESESQATQLLQSMLDPGEHIWETSYIRGSSSGDATNMTKDNTHSSPSRSVSSLPSYHFHGLAQTQTQLIDEVVETNEGSQKENISTRKVHRGEDREVPVQPPLAAQRDASLGLPFLGVTKPEAAGVKAVSFQSPRIKAGVSQAVYNPARRNPTRTTTYPVAGAVLTKPASPVSSEDSFGVYEQDPEQQFLATSRQFNVPLSELPRVVLPSGNSSMSGGRSPNSMRPLGNPRNRLLRSPSLPEGIVLVESTPSASSGSQSQPFLDSQVGLPDRRPDDMEIDAPADDTGDISRYSTDDCLSDAPSSSYYTHLENRDEDNPPPMLEATQPSTQVEENNDIDEHSTHLFDVPAGTSHDRGGTAHSTATTTSRNLLSMVDPRKRYRYRHYQDRPAGPPQVQRDLPASSGAGDSDRLYPEKTQPSFEPDTTMPPPRRFPTRPVLRSSPPSPQHSRGVHTAIAMEETQPSFEEEMPKPAQRRFPARSAPAGVSRRQEGDKDQMDIVPDSEPLCAEATSGSGDNASRSPGQEPIRLGTSREGAEDSTTVDGTGSKASAADVGNALFPASEEEEEEEEDVPIAAVVFNQKQRSSTTAMKGKGRAPGNERQPGKNYHVRQREQSSSAASRKPNTSAPSPTLAHKPGPMLNTRMTRATASLPAKKPSGAGRSWQTGEVPSSLPEQDLENGTASKRPLVDTVAAHKGKGRATTTQTCMKPKRNATVPSGRPRRRGTADDESSLCASDDEPLMPAVDDEDNGTEPVEEEYLDPDFPDPSSRKRKRGAAPSKTTKANSKVSRKTTKVPSTTPSTKQAKRLRSAASAFRASGWQPTRVFALWKQDGHFYPGTVHSHMDGTRYTVHFDDLTEGAVAIDQMRLLDLRVGDDVILPKLARGVKVVDVSKLESSDLVSVRLDSGITEVSLQAIKIASRTISYAWKDRTVSADSLVTTVKPERVKPSPTPSGISFVSGPSTRGLRSSIFEKTALVVTISSNGNWEKEKESVMSAVKNSGGCVINDWSDVIRMEGKHSQGNQRWVIQRADVQWTGKDEIERVFLLADDSSLKPKFLIALALGIPCLSVSWLHDSVALGEEKDWIAYMLPQGYSEALGARASQQVDVDWGNSVHQLNDIMDNRVPCKIFDGKSILCVGSEMVPSPKGKKFTGTEEKTQEAHNAVTRIILAMGADRVEAVSDVRHASASLSSFDLVIIKEANHYGSHLEDGRTVHWPWVKDCLIASRLLPIPEWGQQPSESQDA